MHQNKLILLLRSLNARQLNRLEAFLLSPYHHKQDDNISLFKWLRKYAPRFDHPHLARAQVLAHWPNARGWTDKQLGYLVGRLASQVENFLLWENYQADDWRQAIDRLQLARRLGLENLAAQAWRQLEQLLADYPYRDHHYYERVYQLASLRYAERDPSQRSVNPELQAASTALDHYYASRKLAYGWDMANLEAMLDVHYDHGPEAELVNWLAQQPADEPTLTIYRTALALLRQPEHTAHYTQLKTLLADQAAALPPSQLRELYTALQNFCLRRINQFAYDPFRQEYLSLNDQLIQQGLLLDDDGRLSSWRYLNLVGMALGSGREQWAWDFLHQYRHALPPERANNLYQFALGQYYYQQQDYPAAQRELATVAFEEPLFNWALRSLLARLYFDAHETDLLFNQLEANRLFLLRDQTIDPVRKEQMRHFNDFLRRLAALAPGDHTRRRELFAALPGPNQVLHRDWLAIRLQG